MLIYLGAVILIELWNAPADSSWMEWGLTGVMTLVIINLGYFMGVVLGVIGACLMFALSYSRIGVIRRHLTRQEFSSNVERSPEQSRLLREEGKRVHVFWLSGFIFGSSNGLFERIKRRIDAQRDKPATCGARFRRGARPRYLGGLEPGQASQLLRGARRDARLLRLERQHAGEPSGLRRQRRPSSLRQPQRGVEWCEDMLMHHEVGEASTTVSRAGSNRNSAARSIFPHRFVHGAPGAEQGEFLFRQGAADLVVLSLGQRRHHHHRRA